MLEERGFLQNISGQLCGSSTELRGIEAVTGHVVIVFGFSLAQSVEKCSFPSSFSGLSENCCSSDCALFHTTAARVCMLSQRVRMHGSIAHVFTCYLLDSLPTFDFQAGL